MAKLYHISGWRDIPKNPGDSFILHPGAQGAEGKGVYFSENTPRPSAAEGAVKGVSAIVVIIAETKKDWWRTKSSVAKKYNRPRTWHSDGKSILCQVQRVENNNLFCSWEWAE